MDTRATLPVNNMNSRRLIQFAQHPWLLTRIKPYGMLFHQYVTKVRFGSEADPSRCRLCAAFQTCTRRKTSGVLDCLLGAAASGLPWVVGGAVTSAALKGMTSQ
jgi:hypothetical protein